MKKERKNVMKTIKILTIILLIVLVSMVGFFGIYKQNKNQMANIVKDYTYAMDINGARTIKLALNSENSDETKTEENYNKAKKVIEKRLNKLNVQEYNISLNKTTGEMIIEIPEDSNTDNVVSNLTTVGKFEISDSETKEVLMNNDDIKSSSVLYNTTSSGTSVYLEIAFNKDGKKKLEDISKTYVKSEDNSTENNTVENATEENTSTENSEEATNTENTTTDSTSTTEKKITMKIDDEEIMSTSFDEAITTGKIQLSVGSATTDSSTLNGYISQVQSVATVLDSGNLPVKYDLEKNQYILSDITEQDLRNIAIAVAVILVIGIVVLIAKYKTNGLLAGISFIGLVAIYALLVRYTNVTISIESILGIVIVMILDYIFTTMLLKNIKKLNEEENFVNKSTTETYKTFFNRIAPICIVSIVFCFIKWIPVSSFGMTTFWGLVLIAIYNIIVTKNLLKIKTESRLEVQ